MSSDKLVSNLCDIILTVNDEINRDEAKKYIQNLTEEDISELNKVDLKESKFFSAFLLKRVADYVELYKDPKIKGTPFSFDSSGAFSSFVVFFEDTYKDSNSEPIPIIFNDVFNYIQSMSDHYRIFEKFYTVRSIETSVEILSNAKIQAEEAVTKGINKNLEVALKNTTEQILANANSAQEQAHKAQVQAEVAKEQAQIANTEATTAAETAVDTAVKNKMSEVSTKITENSVTILGIFAGIVLTVVAGLFYSSSVLESINSANFFRVISVASLVGLVCYHLIALMFRSIERIKDSTVAISKISNLDKLISSILIGIVLFFGVLQLAYPESAKTKVDEPTTSIYAEVDVNTKQDDSSSDSSQADETNSVSESTSSNVENSSSEISTNSN